MIVLENCILRNALGYYTRIQDDDKKLDAAIYSMQKLTDADIKCITMTIKDDCRASGQITRKTTIHDFLTSNDSRRITDKDYDVIHYSKYVHNTGQTSFILSIGETPEHFCFFRARTEFPNAEFVVYGDWGCRHNIVNGWHVYTLTGLSKSKFVMISSETELLSDEIYMVMQAYLGEYPKMDTKGEMTVERMNSNIEKLANVQWSHNEVHLPAVQSLCDGSALLEITVLNDRNYSLAET